MKKYTNEDTNYEIGKLLSDAGKSYGEGIIKEYSKKLTYEFKKHYSASLLYKILQFYNIYEKVPTLSGKLSWSHWYEMLSIKDINEIKYYVYQCDKQNLNVRDLRKLIKSKEYERLPEKTKQKITNEEKLEIKDMIPNPIVINNNFGYEVISEKLLQQIILEDIESFLKELGSSFSFIGSEYKLKIGDRFYYIDLLLFNIDFNCYVVIELKITELKKEYIGQIQTYMNYVDKNIKRVTHDVTIGIIICKKDNHFIMEYCSDSRILSREYLINFKEKKGNREVMENI